MTDLTRFDFHAKRFYFSENVRVMSAEEVGQYLLLLVESWMGGKDASLPDNSVLLARYARVQQVSENVLAMFPVIETEHGARRRNETLFQEWSKANQRVEEGRAHAAKRTDRQNPACLITETGYPQGTHKVPNTTPVGVLLTQAKPSQAGSGPARPGALPSQAQAVPAAETSAVLASDGAAAPNPAPDYKTFKLSWQRIVGTSLSNSKGVVEKYTQACGQHGADKVLDAIQYWAKPRTIDWAKTVDFPLGAFFKQLPTLLEEQAEELAADNTRDLALEKANAITEALDAQPKPASADVEASIEKQAQQEQAERAARAARFSKNVEESAGSVEEYL